MGTFVFLVYQMNIAKSNITLVTKQLVCYTAIVQENRQLPELYELGELARKLAESKQRSFNP